MILKRTYLDIKPCPHVLLAEVIPVAVFHFHIQSFVFEDGLDAAKNVCAVLLEVRRQSLHRRV